MPHSSQTIELSSGLYIKEECLFHHKKLKPVSQLEACQSTISHKGYFATIKACSYPNHPQQKVMKRKEIEITFFNKDFLFSI